MDVAGAANKRGLFLAVGIRDVHSCMLKAQFKIGNWFDAVGLNNLQLEVARETKFNVGFCFLEPRT